jgi:membrane protease YdiL (CAAX protease family)
MNAGSAALIEEIAFRGIILFVLVRAWEGSRQGMLGAVLVSSLFFSLVHLLNLLAGEPIGRIAPQAVWSFLGGVFFASLVIRGMSIWPAVLLHASANIAVRLNLQSKPDFRPSARAYAWLAGLASEQIVRWCLPNNSLERTQPQHDFMYDVAVLRRSARNR